MPSLTPYRFDPYTTDTEPGNPAYLGEFRASTKHESPRPDDYLSVELCSGSDYSGDSVTVANKRAFLDRYGTREGVHEFYGGYGTYGVMIRRDALESADNADMRETLADLDSYPLIDEELLSEVEMQAEDEAWQSWARSDYQRALCTHFPDAEEAIEDLDLDTLRYTFESVRERLNTYWVNEMGNGAWVDVDEIANATTIEDLALPVA